MGLQVLHAEPGEDRQVGVFDAARQAAQLLDDGKPAERRVGGRVAALVHQKQPAVAQLAGGVLQQARHLAVGLAVGHVAAQRIDRAAVEPRQDDDQLGPEALKGRHDKLAHGIEIGAVARAGRQRNVDVVALAVALAVFFHEAAVRRVELALVHRDHQRLRIVVEGLLRAVAVVHVPVQEGDTAEAEIPAQPLCRDDAVAEDAEPAAEIRFRMVARRAVQHIGVVDATVHDRPPRGDAAAGRLQGDVVAARAERRQLAGIAAAVGAHLGDAVHVIRRVEQQNVFPRRGVEVGEGDQRALEPRHFEKIVDAALGVGVFGVGLAGLHIAGGGQEGAAAARVVPGIKLVPDIACLGLHSGSSRFRFSICFDRTFGGDRQRSWNRLAGTRHAANVHADQSI